MNFYDAIFILTVTVITAFTLNFSPVGPYSWASITFGIIWKNENNSSLFIKVALFCFVLFFPFLEGNITRVTT